MRELPRGDRSVHGDHKEAMKETTRSKMRSYPTQEVKGRRGTGVGASRGKGVKEKQRGPKENTYQSSRY